MSVFVDLNKGCVKNLLLIFRLLIIIFDETPYVLEYLESGSTDLYNLFVSYLVFSFTRSAR